MKVKKNEITIAVIGLLGILVTAVFSNWDKIFPPKNEIRTNYSGYRATGNFETELRYFLEVSGTRLTYDNLQKELVINLQNSLLKENPENAKKIMEFAAAVNEESISFDNIIKMLLPIYRKYYSIEELQELNKFYSTEVMQNMIKKMPALIQESAPLQLEILKDYQTRLQARIDEIND